MISKKTRLTFRYDLMRGILIGVSHAWVHTFGLLVLIKYFEGSDFFKSLLFSSSFIGMILSTVYPTLANKLVEKKGSAVALPMVASGALMIGASFTDSMVGYALAVFFAFMVLPTHLPLLSSIYHDNFESRNRGQFVSYSMTATQLIATGATWAGGIFLEWDMENFRWMLAFTGFSLMACAYFTSQIPTKKLQKSSSVIRSFRYLYTDPLFGYIVLAWFIFGFANLWVMPIRLQYLTNEVQLPPSQIAILFGVIPELARFFLTPVWAIIFDRFNFIALRMILNGFLMVGVFCFFLSENIYLIGFASAMYGIGFAGGRVAWTLWVTKMVPKEKTAEYMSVHVCMTGLRGSIGPFIGFYLLAILPNQAYQTMGLISAGLTFLSILMLAPVMKYGDSRHLESKG